MRFWFAMGLEPWLVPPAVEMGRALAVQGHDVQVFYIGEPCAPGDEIGFPSMRAPRRGGMLRVLAHADLARLLRRALGKGRGPDLVIACDPLALQAARAVRQAIGRLGYWAFEIVERPSAVRISADFWRATHLARWIRDCEILLAPSASRLKRLHHLASPTTRMLVVPNCRGTRPLRLAPLPVVQRHPVSRLQRLVYAGRVSPAQHILDMVDALRFLPAEVGLLVAGIAFPEYRRELDEHIASHGLSDRCLILDRVSRSQADSLVSDATLGFVLYDRTSDVGTVDAAPNKLGDYAAFGVPMIGSSQEYVRYWLESCGLGVCITHVTPEAIAKAVLTLLDPTRMAKARAACMVAAEGDLNMATHAMALVGALQGTVEDSHMTDLPRLVGVPPT